ncbi:hypothetical protein Btru_025020 [Bulinus truncatus]|nr:hypothetical protein Btru_025020 [Bulinus truncatus]
MRVCMLVIYVCSIQGEDTDNLSCDGNFIKIHRGCYKFVTDVQLGWTEARDKCIEDGADLAVILSDIKQKKYPKLHCAYLDTTLSDLSLGETWLTAGCQTLERISDDRIVCSCDHLTSFAVLMSSVKIPQHNILTVLTSAGCSVSIFCLTVTIVIYFVLWRHIKSERSVLLVNLSISMIVGYFFYIVGIDRTETKLLCTIFAVVLHYCFLLVFFNFLSQSLALYASLNSMSGKTHLKMFLAFTYVGPLIIVSITMSVTKLDGYGTTTQSVIRAIIFLMPIFGVTWIFGLMSLYNDQIVLHYLFVTLNTLQGLFILLFHCMNHRQIKEAFISFRRRKKARSLETIPKHTFTVLKHSL